jgi:hypothetical protein
MEPKDALTCSQEPAATYTNPEPKSHMMIQYIT